MGSRPVTRTIHRYSAALRWIAGLSALTSLVGFGEPSLAASTRDYDVAHGHYYEQSSPEVGWGFVVSDDDAVPLWSEARRLGGTRTLGYPISRRYECDAGVCQAFQRAIFKWSSGAHEVELLNVYDWLHHAGKDAWLDEQWGVPPWVPTEPSPLVASSNEDHPADARKANEQSAMREANAALKAAYWDLGERAPTVHGTARASHVSDTQTVLRTQRTVFVQPIETPAQVHQLPAGSIFVEAGFVPPEALKPVPAPEPLDDTPPVRITSSALGIDATVIAMDMGVDHLLPVPHTGQVVAWYSYSARLGAEGNAVLAGHLDWNQERGVFWSLREAQPGQTLTLTSRAGYAYDYRVDWSRDVAEDAPDGLAALHASGSAPTITLVTCTGRFDVRTRAYEDRRIVRATLSARRQPERAS